jgi:putative ABC transport system permease protein
VIADLRYRLRALFRGGAMDRELADELRFHVDRATQQYVEAGMRPGEARRRAQLEFGGVEQVRETTRSVRGIGVLDVLAQDVRYAWRSLRARPGFTLAIVLTLGLGVAANAVMFGIVDRLLLRAPAYLESSERVHRVYLTYDWNGEPIVNRSTEYRRYRDLVELTTSFEAAAVVSNRTMAVGTGDDVRELAVAAASASFFEFFDVQPVLGRFYTEHDESATAPPVVVLGYGYWQSAYGGRTDVLGEQVQSGATVATIIGVAPRGFAGVSETTTPALYVPAAVIGRGTRADWAESYVWGWLDVLLRRRADVPQATAAAELDAAYARSWELEREAGAGLQPATAARPRAQLAPVQLARGPLAGPDARVAVWVLGVAVIVLLIACANVINLLLARAVQRRREIALRLALGVSRRRLVQQLVTETLVLALLGGVMGLALAHWGGAVVRALFLPDAAFGGTLTDTRTLLFVGSITLGVALLSGVAPALHALREDVADALRGGMRDSGYRSSRTRTALLLVQAALSVVLLTGAGLFVRSLDNVRSLRLGYDTAPVLLIQTNMRGLRIDEDARAALGDRLLAAALSHPAVEHATLVVSVPFWDFETRGVPYVPGVGSVDGLGRFNLQAGSGDYFATIGTRILRGRGFGPQDGATGQPVVVVSRSMADALWPGDDALGRQLRFGADTMPLLTVVGVAEDIRAQQLQGAAEFWYYLPMAQYRARYGATRPALFVRVRGDAHRHADDVRRRLQTELPGPAYIVPTPLAQILAPQQRAWTFGATMFGLFAALALILAALGLYSMSAYAVAQRTRELGVRMALGASVAAVVQLIARQAVLFAAAGIALGVGAVLVAARWLQPLLFDVSARDPVVFGAVAIIMLAVTVAAAVRPALRAARVDPSIVLRE